VAITPVFSGDTAQRSAAEQIYADCRKLGLEALFDDRDERPGVKVHWALVPLVRVDPPVVHQSAWVRNPIDAFVAEQHEKQGLKPRPEATKAILLRRVHLDLIAFPPTRDQLHER
jgi:prolyl-tRNA synthetase